MRPILTTGLLLLAFQHSFAQFATGVRKVSEATAQPVEPTGLWTGFNELPDSGSVCSVTLLVF
jgi:hypothetical protein